MNATIANIIPIPCVRHPGKIRLLALVCLMSCLAACKVTIIVPTGGKVVSDNGEVCLTGQQCTIEMTDATYDDTFRAEPDPGYVFVGWEKKRGYLCGEKTEPCHLDNTRFADNQDILDFIATDVEFYLAPVFGGINRVDAGANNVHTSGLQSSGEIQWRLPAKLDDYSIGLNTIADIQDVFGR